MDKKLENQRKESSKNWAPFTTVVVICIYAFILIERHLEIFNSLLFDIASFQKGRILSPLLHFFFLIPFRVRRFHPYFHDTVCTHHTMP